MTASAETVMPSRLEVLGAGSTAVNGFYNSQEPHIIPPGFTHTCNNMGWNDKNMWNRLTDKKTFWFEHENGSYIYKNIGDGKWWIDGPDGLGLYIIKSRTSLPPKSGYTALTGARRPVPTIQFSCED